MKRFDYTLDYKNIDFTLEENRHLYRIGRGEQGVLLCRPYTDDICALWRFKTKSEAIDSSEAIYQMYLKYKDDGDFIGMDMARKFLEMGFTRSRRYANHRDGKKYNPAGEVKPQEPDALTCEKAQCATIFKLLRDIVTHDEEYIKMRKEWRSQE